MKGVIFDLDDTLVLERDWMASGYDAVASSLCSRGVQVAHQVLVAKMFTAYDSDGSHVFNRLIEDTELAVPQGQWSPIVADCIRTYREHTPSLALAAGVEDLLVWTRGRFRTAIATAGHPTSQRAKITAAGLTDLVDEILYADALPAPFLKPHTRWFAHAAKLLGCRPEDCVHVGDNPDKDFSPAKELGMMTVRVVPAKGSMRTSMVLASTTRWKM
jgi:putative hydrolase of the HAD superfamily